jgi:hypothetical protein
MCIKSWTSLKRALKDSDAELLAAVALAMETLDQLRNQFLQIIEHS